MAAAGFSPPRGIHISQTSSSSPLSCLSRRASYLFPSLSLPPASRGILQPVTPASASPSSPRHTAHRVHTRLAKKRYEAESIKRESLFSLSPSSPIYTPTHLCAHRDNLHTAPAVHASLSVPFEIDESAAKFAFSRRAAPSAVRARLSLYFFLCLGACPGCRASGHFDNEEALTRLLYAEARRSASRWKKLFNNGLVPRLSIIFRSGCRSI